MILKEGVRIHGVQPEITVAMMIVDSIYLANHSDAYPGGVTITSIADGTHTDNSLHYSGCAFDCRIWFLSSAQVAEVAEDIRSQLGEDFDVRVEVDHIHVGWRPRKLGV